MARERIARRAVVVVAEAAATVGEQRDSEWKWAVRILGAWEAKVVEEQR